MVTQSQNPPPLSAKITMFTVTSLCPYIKLHNMSQWRGTVIEEVTYTCKAMLPALSYLTTTCVQVWAEMVAVPVSVDVMTLPLRLPPSTYRHRSLPLVQRMGSFVDGKPVGRYTQHSIVKLQSTLLMEIHV